MRLGKLWAGCCFMGRGAYLDGLEIVKSVLMSCIRDLNYGRRWSEVTNGEAGSTFYRSEESAHSGRSVSLCAWWGRGGFSVQFIRRHVPFQFHF